MAVKWYGDEVRLKIKNATAKMVTEAAFLIEGQTKVNIRNNGQVDTSFMMNTVYAIGPENAHTAVDKSGKYYSSAEQRQVERRAAPLQAPPEDGGIVGVAAEYAIYQEARIPFLYPAVETVAAIMAGEIVAAGKDAL